MLGQSSHFWLFSVILVILITSVLCPWTDCWSTGKPWLCWYRSQVTCHFQNGSCRKDGWLDFRLPCQHDQIDVVQSYKVERWDCIDCTVHCCRWLTIFSSGQFICHNAISIMWNNEPSILITMNKVNTDWYRHNSLYFHILEQLGICVFIDTGQGRCRSCWSERLYLRHWRPNFELRCLSSIHIRQCGVLWSTDGQLV